MLSISSLSLAAIASFLTPQLLIQPAAGLDDIVLDEAIRGLPSWDLNARDEGKTEGEIMRPLPSWGYDATWQKRDEFDLSQLNPVESDIFLWGGTPSMFTSLWSLDSFALILECSYLVY